MKEVNKDTESIKIIDQTGKSKKRKSKKHSFFKKDSSPLVGTTKKTKASSITKSEETDNRVISPKESKFKKMKQKKTKTKKKKTKNYSFLIEFLKRIVILILNLLLILLIAVLMVWVVMEITKEVRFRTQSAIELKAKQISEIYDLKLNFKENNIYVNFYLEEVNEEEETVLNFVELSISRLSFNERGTVPYPYLRVVCREGETTCRLDEAEKLELNFNSEDVTALTINQ